MKFIRLINVKMPIDILTFMSRINTTSECFMQEFEKIFILQYFTFYRQSKFHAQAK